MDSREAESERGSTTARSSPAARTAPVGPVTAATHSAGRHGQRESSEASPAGRPISPQDPSGQNGTEHTRTERYYDIKTPSPEPGSNASTTQRRAPIDLTRRSAFLAVDKQLAQYFKKASAMNWPLFLVLLSSTFCDEKRHHIAMFRVSSAISLALNLVPLFLAGWMSSEEEAPSSEEFSADEYHDCERVEPHDRYRILALTFAAYLSNFSLTVTAISFAMLFRAGYAWFFLMLVGLVLPYYFIIAHGTKHDFTWGLAQYAEHRSDMDFFFGLCFEITQTNFTALSATLFGYLKTGRRCMDVEFRAPEIILLVAVVIGLFVITMCTVPPAAGLPCYRDFLVRQVMKLTIYGLLVLTSLGLFLAVLKVCGPYVCLSIVVAVVDVIAFFFNDSIRSTMVACFKKLARSVQRSTGTSEDQIALSVAASSEAGNASSRRPLEFSASRTRESQRSSEPAPARGADEQSLLLVSFYSVMSGALMASYSLNIRDQRRGYKASLVTMYSAILAYLGMVIITREATKGKAMAVWMSSIIATALLIAALVCVIVFVLSNPVNIGSSST